MTEFGFIVALEVGGFVLALTMARSAGAREPGAAVYRVISALVRAARSFLARERPAVAGAALLGIAAVAAFHALVGRIELVFLVVGGLVVGASLCFVSAGLAMACTGRAAGAAHASARLGFNALLAVALRAGGAIGIGTETASTLGAFALFGVTYVAQGGRAADGSAQALSNPCLTVVGYALGAALAALVVERAGSVYQVGAEAGRGRATFDPTGDDPRNPALVASFVGDHIGPVAAGSAGLFALSAVATAAVFVGAQGLGASANDQLEIAALPLICRSFGMVGCSAGTLAARADEAQGQGLALFRGLASALAITLLGILGASYWLAAENFWFFAVAGTLGLGAAALPAAAELLRTDRNARAVRAAVAALRAGASAAFGASLGDALARAALPVAGVVAFAIAASALGDRATLLGGAMTGGAVFALSLVALAPYALAAVGMSSVARSARGTTALSKLDTEGAWRLQRLDDVGFRASAPARATLFAGSAFAALPALAPVFAAKDSLGLGRAGALLVGVLGVAAVLAHAGRTARRASETADEVALEVERQIGGPEPGQSPEAVRGGAGTPTASDAHGGAGAPPHNKTAGFTPSYRACEELTQAAASAGLVADTGWALAPLVLLGIGLGLVYRVGGSRLAAAAVATFVATAAVTALGAALAVDGARTVHGGARRSARLERETASPAAPTSEDVLANILGIAAGPSACLQALLLTSFALVLLQTLTSLK